MTRDELLDKLIKQHKSGLITIDELWSEVREADLMDLMGMNEGIAR